MLMATGLMSVVQAQTHSLADIRRGMVVYDHDQEPIGTVVSVIQEGDYQGEASGESVPKSQSLIPTISGTFVGEDRLPELLYVKLTRTGFARVKPADNDAATYYITPPQIEIVGNKAIYLKVPKRVLLRS
jgi:hypothetical protein